MMRSLTVARTGPATAARLNEVASVGLNVENRHNRRVGGAYEKTTQGESRHMAQVTIVYWRDIPAQVIVGKGRRGTKVPLPERFEQAIDRAAMKSGAAGTDDYLAEWRKAAPYAVEGDDDAVARAEAARLAAEYDTDRIKTLIANDGWA